MSEIVIGCGPRDLSHRHYPRLVGELRLLPRTGRSESESRVSGEFVETWRRASDQ